MSDLFLYIVNASVAAAWVVLAVVVARLLLRKSPRSLVCALWILVGLRLVCNGLFQFPFSLVPSAEIIPPESLYDLAPVIDSGVEIIDQVVNPVYTDSLRTDGMSSVNPLQVWIAVFANLWVLGMAAMVIWALVSWLRVRRQVRESICHEDGIFLCDRIDSPFLFGLFAPRIYLPSDLSKEAMAHVIAHERAHLVRRDHWWKPLAFLLLTIHWFNPVMWLAYCLLCRDIELACDECVIRKLGADGRKAYSSALLSCSIPHRHISACPLAFGEVGVKQRIRSVLHYKKPAFWIVLTAAVLCAVLAVCALADPVDQPEGPALIRYHDALYILDEGPVDQLPDKQQFTDTLRSVLQYGTSHPTEHNQATGLDRKYAGQTMVFVGNALYLEQPGGGSWLRFKCISHVPSENPLGITLSVDNVTASGLTLICTQDGTLWTNIITGSPFTLEQYRNGAWVSLMPEKTVWTSIAYMVNQGGTTQWSINWSNLVGSLDPGLYRIGKSFSGDRTPPVTLGMEHETVEQTCYAEFTIE